MTSFSINCISFNNDVRERPTIVEKRPRINERNRLTGNERELKSFIFIRKKENFEVKRLKSEFN